MSIPLKDFRLGIDEAIDMWLEIEASVRKTDKAAIGREVLRAWAREKGHAYKLATKRLAANGIQPELFGEDPAEDGIASKQGVQRR